MTAGHGYRTEDGHACIDIHVETSHHLFDRRDPAPFRERDLDVAAVEYVVGAVEDLPPGSQPKLVVWVARESPSEVGDDTIAEAVRAHFGREIAGVNRRIRKHVRQGQLYLLVGLSALVLFLSLAELTLSIEAGHLRQVLREGLVITGWVAMWRPLEALLYDWWPLVQERRLARRVLSLPIAVRFGKTPPPPSG